MHNLAEMKLRGKGMMKRYMSPYTDFGYHKLLVQPSSGQLLIDFLNGILPAHHRITAITSPEERARPFAVERLLHFVAITHAGAPIHIGLKFERRLWPNQISIFTEWWRAKWLPLLHACLQDAIPVYLIAILDFEYDEHEERRKFLREVQLKDQDGDVFFDKLHFKFVQMPLFHKEAHELETHFDKWLYFLKNLAGLEEIPAILREPIFEKAFHTAEVGKLTGDELFAYQMSQIDYWDMTAAIDSAEENGIQKGRELGLQEGRLQAQTENIRRMATKGMSAAAIADLLDLPIDEVEAALSTL